MLRSTNLFTYPKLSRKQNKANIKCRLNAEMRIHHGSPVKNLPVIPHRFNPWVVRSPGEGNGNPLQFSYLGNPMGREAWQAIVNRFTRVRHALVTKPQHNLNTEHALQSPTFCWPSLWFSTPLYLPPYLPLSILVIPIFFKDIGLLLDSLSSFRSGFHVSSTGSFPKDPNQSLTPIWVHFSHYTSSDHLNSLLWDFSEAFGYFRCLQLHFVSSVFFINQILSLSFSISTNILVLLLAPILVFHVDYNFIILVPEYFLSFPWNFG